MTQPDHLRWADVRELLLSDARELLLSDSETAAALEELALIFDAPEANDYPIPAAFEDDGVE